MLGYSESVAAGSGIVLTEDGLILTNNHVIDGATEISVTIVKTGETYAATLYGMIEVLADVVSGDSGGALLDGTPAADAGLTASGQVLSATVTLIAGPA
ncbi:hypothetical protein R2Q81_02065 [Microbacterium aquimaris]|uniref:trypsin-like peptidase domain-containing protein n=1 Tax=Microbacterium aquimaris TaxID=459816 RepID=UPI002AD30A8D|nr:trypsin-like peptidase domain-containing protein [Microbacterium aquimaris]MDZ8274725.1 hypothetical protein [Microbacterium aquimaris]